MIKKYKIVLADSLGLLTTRVTRSLDEGWTPQGGVVFANQNYLQAMVRS